MTILILFCVLAFVLFLSALDCYFHIDTVRCHIEGFACHGELLLLSDLHGWRYGKNNCRLLRLIEAQNIQIVIIAGDMLNRHAGAKQLERVCGFLSALCKSADVYYALGNHEADFIETNGTALLEKLSACGVKLLIDEWTETDCGGASLRLGAAHGRYLNGSEKDEKTLQMLKEIGSDRIPSIAVVHQPENVLNYITDEWTAGLYLCGHTHGGVWRIPGLGGVLSPGEGLFPKYDKGLFDVHGKPMFIGGGLAGYSFIPRVFNRPQICIIEL